MKFKNNNIIIKYNRFSIIKFLYEIYNKFRTEIDIFIKRYKINICFLYYLLMLIKKESENIYPKDVILYKYKPISYIFDNEIYEYINIYKNDNLLKNIYKLYNKNNNNIINAFLNTNNNNIIILYKNVFKTKLKKYIENKKKKARQKKSKQKKNKILDIKYVDIKVSILNNELLNEKIDSGWMNIKIWPLKYDTYKDFLQYEIKYFHCYYCNNINNKSAVLFYDINNEITYREITYKDLYYLLVKEYNKESVLSFINCYYKGLNFIL